MSEKKSKFRKGLEEAKRLWEVVIKPDGRGLKFRIQTERMRRRKSQQDDGRDYE